MTVEFQRYKYTINYYCVRDNECCIEINCYTTYVVVTYVAVDLCTVYWEIFEVQNFRGLVILKFFANKFSRMAIYTGNGHVHVF